MGDKVFGINIAKNMQEQLEHYNNQDNILLGE
jgi:hypothetical protein